MFSCHVQPDSVDIHSYGLYDLLRTCEIPYLIYSRTLTELKKTYSKSEKTYSLSITFFGFHINFDPKRSKNGLKRSKMIKIDQKRSKIIN